MPTEAGRSGIGPSADTVSFHVPEFVASTAIDANTIAIETVTTTADSVREVVAEVDPMAGGAILGGVVLLAFVLNRMRRGRRELGPLTPGAADRYLRDSDLYDVEELKELGVYDELLDAVDRGEVTSERTFGRLCDRIVVEGKDWEDALDFDDLDDVSKSWKAHEDAQERPPPVEIGEVVELGLTDFRSHYSGERHGVGKVEGFVIFVEDLPESISRGDVVRAKVMHYNRGKTSASATFRDVVT